MYHTGTSPKGGWVYIISNKNRTTLYIGMTANIRGRIHLHRIGEGSKFAKRYNLTDLIYYEWYDHITEAIRREKQLKEWNRQWKIDLIHTTNPDMNDLWETLWEGVGI